MWQIIGLCINLKSVSKIHLLKWIHIYNNIHSHLSWKCLNKNYTSFNFFYIIRIIFSIDFCWVSKTWKKLFRYSIWLIWRYLTSMMMLIKMHLRTCSICNMIWLHQICIFHQSIWLICCWVFLTIMHQEVIFWLMINFNLSLMLPN